MEPLKISLDPLPHCGIGNCTKPGKWRRQNTAYQCEVDNWTFACDECFEMVQEYWDNMWDDYNSSRG